MPGDGPVCDDEPSHRVRISQHSVGGFAALLARLHAIDLVFINSHHEESQCRRQIAELRNCTNMIALHDVYNVGCPGIGKVWQEIKAVDEYVCFEFKDQYPGRGPYMGIGLAVKKERLAASKGAGHKEEDQ